MIKKMIRALRGLFRFLHSAKHLKAIEVAIFHVHAGRVGCECLSADTNSMTRKTKTKKNIIIWPHNMIFG